MGATAIKQTSRISGSWLVRRALSLGVVFIARAISQGLQILSGCYSPCRFEPSCSTYTEQAVFEFGLWRGVVMGAKRVARCRPGHHAWGCDPVVAEGSPAARNRF